MKSLGVIVVLVLSSLFYQQVRGGGVKQCYQCGENCASTARVKTCPDSEQTNVCTSHKIRIGGETYEAKDCAVYNTNTIQTCNYLAQSGRCYLCFEDLCNLGW